MLSQQYKTNATRVNFNTSAFEPSTICETELSALPPVELSVHKRMARKPIVDHSSVFKGTSISKDRVAKTRARRTLAPSIHTRLQALRSYSRSSARTNF